MDGVIESLVKSKKYVLPLAYLNPWVTGSLVAAYFGGGRFHPDPHAAVFDPELATAEGPATRATEQPAAGVRDVSSNDLPRP